MNVYQASFGFVLLSFSTRDDEKFYGLILERLSIFISVLLIRKSEDVVVCSGFYLPSNVRYSTEYAIAYQLDRSSFSESGHPIFETVGSSIVSSQNTPQRTRIGLHVVIATTL